MLHRPLLALLLFAAVVACSDEATVPALGEQLIELRVSPAPTSLAPGQSTTITATLTNTLDEDVLLIFPSTCQILVYVRDAMGRVVTPAAGHNCPRVVSQLGIPALGTVTRTVTWDGRGEFGTGGTTARLPAGKYYVSARLEADNYRTVGFPVLVTLVD